MDRFRLAIGIGILTVYGIMLGSLGYLIGVKLIQNPACTIMLQSASIFWC